MRLELNLPAEVSIALRRMAQADDLSHEDAAAAVLRDWLIGHGYLELEHGMDDEAASET